LDHVIHKTKIMVSWRHAAEFKSLQKESIQQENYNHCILDLKFSKPLTPVQIMGPGEEYQSQSSDGELSVLPSERQLFAIGATIAAAHGMLASNLPNPNHLLPPSSCRLQCGRWDELSTLSVTLDVDESPTDDTYAYVQTICRYGSIVDTYMFVLGEVLIKFLLKTKGGWISRKQMASVS